MYCKNCGSEMNEQAAFCLKCGVAKGSGNDYCFACGSEVNKNASVCLKCGSLISGETKSGKRQKWLALLLWFLFGVYGAHWFYLGYKNRGVANIIFTIGSSIITGVGYAVMMSGMGLYHEDVVLMICGGFAVFVGGIMFLGIGIYNLVAVIKILMGTQKDADGNELV